MNVYFNKAQCDGCHEGVNFTANSFNNLGIGADKPDPDAKCCVVTKNDEDWGRFKTPTLRDISTTAPYMHDGSLQTLDEILDFYDRGGIPNRNLDEKIVKLHLTPAEKKDLVEFLKALDGKTTAVAVPTAFPR
jgi:cytochrome c peroxidase